MHTKWITRTFAASAIALSAAAAGCGEMAQQSRSPVQAVITELSAARGSSPEELSNTLQSDVITNVTTPEPCSTDSPCPTFFNDVGEVTMTLISKDPGVPGITAAPSLLNQVTFNKYRVVYRRTDGNNVPGTDVPHAFDSAITFTVPNDGSITVNFQIVRHSAKEEAPLRALAFTNVIISTIAEVTFYGHDQSGNEVIASGSIGIDFGNFADQS